MRVYEVDIVCEGSTLKALSKAFKARLAEFILAMATAEAEITSVTTAITASTKVTEKNPQRSEAIAIDRLWTCTRTYAVTLHETGDAAEPEPVTNVNVGDIIARLDALLEADRLMSDRMIIVEGKIAALPPVV
jgi:hypothetical protein